MLFRSEANKDEKEKKADEKEEKKKENKKKKEEKTGKIEVACRRLCLPKVYKVARRPCRVSTYR